MQNNMYLFTHKKSNTVKTILLMGGTFLLLVIVGYVLSERYGNINFIYAALGISIVMNVSMYWFSAPLALKTSGAKPIDRATPEGDRVYRAVSRLSSRAGLSMPGSYIIEDANPNAFATGRNKEHAAVAVTTGLLTQLNDAELDGVIAHELAHIGNKDILISSVVAVMAGVLTHLVYVTASSRGDGEQKGSGVLGLFALILAPIAASMIQLAVSRSREFQADATAALITGKPEDLAQALLKIHAHNHTPLERADPSTAHMYISNPFGEDSEGKKTGFLAKLFMSHPSVEERVAKLRG